MTTSASKRTSAPSTQRPSALKLMLACLGTYIVNDSGITGHHHFIERSGLLHIHQHELRAQALRMQGQAMPHGIQRQRRPIYRQENFQHAVTHKLIWKHHLSTACAFYKVRKALKKP
jgi:hypothetical protein